jgi:hypothetical protein
MDYYLCSFRTKVTLESAFLLVDEPDVVDQGELVLHPLAADLAFANLQNLQLLVLLNNNFKIL